jgi:hypothetical protein
VAAWPSTPGALEGAEQRDDQVYDAVRGEINQKRQRVVIGPWSSIAWPALEAMN